MTEISISELSPSDLLTLSMRAEGAPLPWIANDDAEIWSADGKVRIIRVSEALPSRVRIAQSIARSINLNAGFAPRAGDNVMDLRRRRRLAG